MKGSIYKILFPIVLCFFWLKIKFYVFFLSEKNVLGDGVLYLENFPVENSGYQYRAGKWAEKLSQKGIRCEIKTIFPEKRDYDACSSQKFLLVSMRKRFHQCLYARKFKTVIVRRELLQFNDYGNLFIDKFLLKIHPNVILDFDDDISAAKKQPRKITSVYGKLLGENGNKFNETLRLYSHFIVGSDYLKKKVLLENKNISDKDVIVIPTCVDYDEYPPKVYDENVGEIVLGWIGGNHNLHYIDMLVEPLNKLAEDYKFKLVVVAGRDYSNPMAKFMIENRSWSLDGEKDLIRSFDLGLMPIEDNAVGRGKCGFKLLQYMGLGVIGIATDVTINGEIIKDGENGFLVKSDNSNWYEVLKKALEHKLEYGRIGSFAALTIHNTYSFNSNLESYTIFVS